MNERFVQLGINIARCRSLKGWTQKDLAREAGVSRTHISNIEAPGSAAKASISTLFAISDALGVPITDLFDFTER